MCIRDSVVTILGMLITVYLVTQFFSISNQGYYFTFASLIMWQIILEMGFGRVLLQFLTHECAHVTVDYHRNEVVGSEHHLRLIKALLLMGVKWHLIAAMLFVLLNIPLGILYFYSSVRDYESLVWPWVFLSIAVGLNMVVLGMRLAVEGARQLGRVHASQLAIGIAMYVVAWVAIYNGAELYALALMYFTMAFSGAICYGIHIRPFWNLWEKYEPDPEFSWRGNFSNNQIKLGLNWVCGYFMFYSITPIVLTMAGPVAAGKIGASMQLFQGLNSLGRPWVAVQSPRIGALAAKQQFHAIRKLVKITTYITMGLVGLASIAILVILTAFHSSFNEKLVDMNSLVLLLLTATALQMANIETSAIRFMKLEPFLLSSVVAAVFVVIGTFYLAGEFGVNVVCGWCFLMIVVFLCPWVHFIYKSVLN